VGSVTRELVRLGPQDWQAQRELRLAALLDAPEAFGTTHAQMATHTEADWRADLGRIAAWQVRDDGMPVGMVRMVVADEDGEVVPADEVAGRAGSGALTAYLISMFVAREARGTGAGELLVRTVLDHAKSLGLQQVWLDVRSTNGVAGRLYERCGFVRTGQRKPHPREACECEWQYVCTL
jgi:ribosomal protein S18 acetylase RimI-like enzyme